MTYKKTKQILIFVINQISKFRDYFNIFDNQKRSYRLRLNKRLKVEPLLLPVSLFRNAKFYFKRGKRYTLPRKNKINFSIYI